MKIGISKGLRKICMVVLLCILFGLLTSSCDQSNETIGETTTEAINSSVTTEETPFFESIDCVLPAPTVLQHYIKGYKALFLKLEIVKIFDDIFIETKHYYHRDSKYLLMECKVKADLYDSGYKIDEKIFVPICLNINVSSKENPDGYASVLDLQETKEWLLSCDFIYIYSKAYESLKYTGEDNSELQIETEIHQISFDLYEIIPCTNGEIHLQLVDDFFQKYSMAHFPHSLIVGMDKICYDGISCEEFENNISEMSEYFDNRESSN